MQIKGHNNISGNNREDWEYLDDMDAILGIRPHISISIIIKSISHHIMPLAINSLKGRDTHIHVVDKINF